MRTDWCICTISNGCNGDATHTYTGWKKRAHSQAHKIHLNENENENAETFSFLVLVHLPPMLLLRVSLFVLLIFLRFESVLCISCFSHNVKIFGHAVKNDTYHNQRAFIGLCIGCQFYRLSLLFVRLFCISHIVFGFCFVFFFFYFGRLSQVEAVQHKTYRIAFSYYIHYGFFSSSSFSLSIWMSTIFSWCGMCVFSFTSFVYSAILAS